MNQPDSLITALADEDRRLRRLLDECPPGRRELRGINGGLSFKETLGHLAFWDSFAVKFFTSRLEPAVEGVCPPVNFEKLSRQDLDRVRQLPFDEVLEFYTGATRCLETFLRDYWDRLSAREREDFMVPLKHRRHHRLLLRRSRDAVEDGPRGKEREAEA